MNGRISKINYRTEIELHRNYRYRAGGEPERLSLVESSDLIIREVKHSGAAGKIKALSDNRPLPA